MFTSKDVGCYADGAYGHARARRVLYELLLDYQRTLADPANDYAETFKSLSGDMPDDAWDEDNAIDMLNDSCCDGVRFEFIDGDLMLVSNDEA